MGARGTARAGRLAVLLMILVDISSFPTLTYERFQSISLALSAASVLAVYLSVGIIRHWLESRS